MNQHKITTHTSKQIGKNIKIKPIKIAENFTSQSIRADALDADELLWLSNNVGDLILSEWIV